MGRITAAFLTLALTMSHARHGGSLVAAATSLQTEGQILFQSDTALTIAASYRPFAVCATVSSKSNTDLAIHTGKRPKNVFLGAKKLDGKAWSYDEKTACVRLGVAAGTSEVQIRFDDVESIAPREADIPLVLCGPGWESIRQLGQMKALCAKEHLHAAAPWEGAGGLYRIRAKTPAKTTASITLTATASGSISPRRETIELPAGGEVLLDKGCSLAIEGDTRGSEIPVEQIQLQLVHGITAARTVPKDQLDLSKSVLVEGEAFAAEGGGEIKESTEHQNTHGGGCIFTWADAGHWISWVLAVPQDGRYLLTIVAATAEEAAVRSLRIDGRELPDAELIAFTRTGGWGRTDPDEWQAFRPVDGKGRPVSLTLTKGKHELRMENVLGQHLNIDYVLLTPCP